MEKKSVSVVNITQINTFNIHSLKIKHQNFKTFGEKTYILPTCDSTLTTELPQRYLSEEERDSTGRQEDDIRDQENT